MLKKQRFFLSQTEISLLNTEIVAKPRQSRVSDITSMRESVRRHASPHGRVVQQPSTHRILICTLKAITLQTQYTRHCEGGSESPLPTRTRSHAPRWTTLCSRRQWHAMGGRQALARADPLQRLFVLGCPRRFLCGVAPPALSVARWWCRSAFPCRPSRGLCAGASSAT